MIRTFIFLFIFANQSFAADSLPLISIKGNVCHVNQRINIHARVKSTSSLNMCNYIRRNVDSLSVSKTPHSYTFWGNTNSSPQNSFYYSFPLMDLLTDRIEQYINNGAVKLPEGSTIEKYVSLCDFRVSQIAIDFDSATNSEDTYVIIRNAFYQDGEYPNKYELNLTKGTTHIRTFPFSLIDDKQSFIINLK